MEEVDLVVKSILDKVKTLRAAHDERTKIIRELTGHIDLLERERTTFVESYSAKVDNLEPKHKEIKVRFPSSIHYSFKSRLLKQSDFCSQYGICLPVCPAKTGVCTGSMIKRF